MAALATTTLEQLEPLVVAQVLATVPKLVYLADEKWKHYAKAASAASNTRRLRVIWGQGSFVAGGIFTGGPEGAADTLVPLTIRVDYAGLHERLQWVVQSDWTQLRFRLASLAHDPANGVVLVLPGPPPTRAADTNETRNALSRNSAASSNTFQMDLTYELRYMQANE